MLSRHCNLFVFHSNYFLIFDDPQYTSVTPSACKKSSSYPHAWRREIILHHRTVCTLFELGPVVSPWDAAIVRYPCKYGAYKDFVIWYGARGMFVSRETYSVGEEDKSMGPIHQCSRQFTRVYAGVGWIVLEYLYPYRCVRK